MTLSLPGKRVSDHGDDAKHQHIGGHEKQHRIIHKGETHSPHHEAECDCRHHSPYEHIFSRAIALQQNLFPFLPDDGANMSDHAQPSLTSLRKTSSRLMLCIGRPEVLARSSCGLPWASNLPFRITATLEHSLSASDKLCVVRNTVTP